MSAKRGIEQGKSPQKRQRLESGRESSIEEKPSGPEKVFMDLLHTDRSQTPRDLTSTSELAEKDYVLGRQSASGSRGEAIVKSGR